MVAYTSQPDDHVLGLMPKQFQFVNDTMSKEILYSGAFGAGKSRAVCVRAARLAQNPRARVGLFRKTLAALRGTTLVTLLSPDGDLPPVLPMGTYHYHKQDQVIRIHGGGEIPCLGCDNELRVASTPLTDALIDESIELDLKEYQMILGRLRVQYTKPDGTKNINTCASATNPGSPGHFLHERFYQENNPTRLCIDTNTGENYHLPDDYVQQLSEFVGVAHDRYFKGMWVAFEGQIYWMFSKGIHEVNRRENWDYYVAGVDWGSTNPAVLRVHACKEGDEGSHVVSEFYQNKIISDDFVDVCSEAARHFSPMTFVLDPSAADIRLQMIRAGLNTFEADNRVLPGIRVMENSLSWGQSKAPRLTMEPSCRKGNKEYLTYQWKDGLKEEPLKQDDHAVDADRYARMYIMAGLGEEASWITLGGDQESLAERRQRKAAEAANVETIKPFDPLAEQLWPQSRY